MKLLYSLILFVAAVTLVACGPNQEELAKQSITQSEEIFAQGDTLKAADKLDSLIRVSSQLPEIKTEAIKLRKGYLREVVLNKKKQMNEAEAAIPPLSKNFIRKKGEFDRIASYIPKRQTLKRSWDRSFIEVHLNEKGELYLSSNYMGDHWLNHTGIRVYDKGDQAKTETIPVGDVNNHHSDFGNMRWEKVNYKEGKSDAVIEFISNNVDRNLKTVFLGNKYHYILLESYDKEAIRNALTLSKALKKKAQYEKELLHFRKMMNKY